MKEAILYRKLENYKTECNICQKRCVTGTNKKGFCKTRKNIDGKLYTLIYAKVASIAVSPIEKKPLFHFYPGSRWLSLGTLGCNFRCPGCQNYDLSFAEPEITGIKNKDQIDLILPEEAVELAREYRCKGISWTYNEPTIWFEYTYITAKLAKQNNLLTNYVTNGSITEEALDLIGPYLDSFRVDLKGFTDEFYIRICHISDFRPILEVTKRAKFKWEMHVEVVTNIIPGYSDDEEQLKGIANWIKEELGKDTPWHVTQFVPHLELSHLSSTPVKTLEKAREIGLEVGLEYVYIGNIPGHKGENTYCPKCKNLLIERDGFSIIRSNLAGNRCNRCNYKIWGEF